MCYKKAMFSPLLSITILILLLLISVHAQEESINCEDISYCIELVKGEEINCINKIDIGWGDEYVEILLEINPRLSESDELKQLIEARDKAKKATINYKQKPKQEYGKSNNRNLYISVLD